MKGSVSLSSSICALRTCEADPFRLRRRRLIGVYAASCCLEDEICLSGSHKGLFYRINASGVGLPPRRRRCEAVSVLLDSFLSIFNDHFDSNRTLPSKDSSQIFQQRNLP